jgi:hypothetical protein
LVPFFGLRWPVLYLPASVPGKAQWAAPMLDVPLPWLRGTLICATQITMKLLLAFLCWCLLLAVCWPLAFLALLLFPLVWLLLLPFRLLGIVVEGALALVKALFFLPARLLGCRAC